MEWTDVANFPNNTCHWRENNSFSRGHVPNQVNHTVTVTSANKNHVKTKVTYTNKSIE